MALLVLRAATAGASLIAADFPAVRHYVEPPLRRVARSASSAGARQRVIRVPIRSFSTDYQVVLNIIVHRIIGNNSRSVYLVSLNRNALMYKVEPTEAVPISFRSAHRPAILL
jgi:hypothetical protein